MIPLRIRVLLHLLAAALMLAPLAAWSSFEIAPWPKNRPVPVLALSDLDGQAWTSKSLAGKVVLLNFWATWCEPCRAEMPALSALAKQHGRDKLVVLAINYQENEPRIRRFLEVVPVAFPVLLDQDGAAARAWTRRIFPTTVVIGVDGRPRHIVTGEYDWSGEAAARLLGPLLAAGNK